MPTEIATFGAGCFWGVEHLFRRVPGVIEAVSGYSGGFVENPSYQLVCTDTTGHAEVVQVTFDTEVVSFDQLLEVFWAMHDPTQVNRQGPDRGSQYRSIVLTHSDEQKAQAEASRDRAERAVVGCRPARVAPRSLREPRQDRAWGVRRRGAIRETRSHDRARSAVIDRGDIRAPRAKRAAASRTGARPLLCAEGPGRRGGERSGVPSRARRADGQPP